MTKAFIEVPDIPTVPPPVGQKGARCFDPLNLPMISEKPRNIQYNISFEKCI